jgi:hypothetical protein
MLAVLITLTTAMLGCGGEDPAAVDQPSPPLVNPALGLTISSVPSSLKVKSNQESDLVLVPADATRSGRLEVTVEDTRGGVNLVAAVQRHRERFESTVGGEYRGTQELVTPLGSAYWSRGRLPTEQGLVEQARVMAVHPSGTRLLALTYTYPAGDDTNDRAQELLAVLSEIEPGPE